MTKNFKREEFEAKRFPKKATTLQNFLLEMLVNNLQNVRDLYPTTYSIISCYRNMEDYFRLVSEGYFPSRTSDHFWTQEICPTSVGAVDVSCKDNKQLFNAAKRYNDSHHNTPFGQVIYEETKKGSWVHLSNNIQNVYSTDYLSYLLNNKLKIKHRMYLASYDGGDSYQDQGLFV